MDYKIAVRMIMPFGKYKGEQLGDIPDNYLQWIIDNVDDLALVKAAQVVLYPNNPALR